MCSVARSVCVSLYIYILVAIYVLLYLLELSSRKLFLPHMYFLRPPVHGRRIGISPRRLICVPVLKKIDLYTFIYCAAIQKRYRVLERQWAHHTPGKYCTTGVDQHLGYSLSTFAMWQHGYVSLLLVRERQCDAERAIR